MRVIRHPKFKDDLLNAFHYLNGQESGLGEHFLDVVEKAISKIKANPLAWSKIYRNVRRAHLEQFNQYALRYRFVEDKNILRILGVIHGARHPDFGKNRT